LLEQKALTSTFMADYFGDNQGAFTIRPDAKMPDGFDPRTRPWYKDAVNSSSASLTEPYIDAVTGQLIISIATAVKKPVRTGRGRRRPESANHHGHLNALNFNGMGYAFLISGDGKILVHPDKTLVMKYLKDIYPQDTPPSAALQRDQVNGKTRIVTFTPVKGLGSSTGTSVCPWTRTKPLPTAHIPDIGGDCHGDRRDFDHRPARPVDPLAVQPAHHDPRHADIAEGEGDLTRRLDYLQRRIRHPGQCVQRLCRAHSPRSAKCPRPPRRSTKWPCAWSAPPTRRCQFRRTGQRTNSVAAAINELGAAAQRSPATPPRPRTGQRRPRPGEEGQQVVERSISSMKQLSKCSASSGHIESLNSKTVNIGQILEVITSISQQTNLLALNAAIEAARAGEAGRGFAVVADEVRNLAHRTQESAQQVQAMIEELQVGARASVSTMDESQRHSEDSVEIANLAGERLVSVTQRIGEIDGMNQSVATATEEQTSVVESINMDITEINTLNQEGIENLQSTLRACTDLEQQAARLKQLVGSFRI
jgi:methyl-accepting chemotaxis protein